MRSNGILPVSQGNDGSLCTRDVVKKSGVHKDPVLPLSISYLTIKSAPPMDIDNLYLQVLERIIRVINHEGTSQSIAILST